MIKAVVKILAIIKRQNFVYVVFVIVTGSIVYEKTVIIMIDGAISFIIIISVSTSLFVNLIVNDVRGRSFIMF